MQLRPDASTLLQAVTQFLLSDLLPNVTDKALAFKVMIAANLTGMVASELTSDDERLSAELKRLQALLPGVVDGAAENFPTRTQRVDALTRLNTALSDGLRNHQFDDGTLQAITAHVRQTTLETLQATNPRFDTSPVAD